MLASRLVKQYRYENCAIVAIDDGGVVVGAQIAMQLHCILNLMVSTEIGLPQEPVSLAGITTSGAMAYNSQYSAGELEELLSENRVYFEQEKMKSMHELNQLITGIGTIDKRFLRGHNIIVVSEGFKSAFTVELVYEFLKPINFDKLIFAAPLASVSAVDRMHVLGDELYCLDVVQEYLDTNHYYDVRDIPSHEKVIKIIEQVILNWK